MTNEIPKEYYVLHIGAVAVVVDKQTKTTVENTLTSDCQLIYLRDLYGAEHIVRPSEVRHIFQSTAQTRMLIALHKLQQQTEQAQIIKGVTDGSV